jgi:hypothetical protein
VVVRSAGGRLSAAMVVCLALVIGGAFVALAVSPVVAWAGKAPEQCRAPGDPKILALNNPVDSAAAVKTIDGRRVNERTEYFVGGTYWVTQCSSETGKPLESTLVGDVQVLGERIRAPLTVITPQPGKPDHYYTVSATQAATAPVGQPEAVSAAARRKLTRLAPPPTDEAKRRKAARPSSEAPAAFTKCRS